MKNFKVLTLKIIYFLKEKVILLSFLISVFTVLLILFKLLNLNVILGISNIPFLNLLFNSFVILSTIYCILFLPSYPLFFIIFKEKSYTILEKLGLTLIVNLAFYILLGYFGFIIINEITGIFIYFSTVITFLSIILYIILIEIKTKRYNLFKSYKSSFSIDLIRNRISFLNLVKNKIHLNAFLLIIFLLLICFLNIVRFNFFYGTDAWLHITIIKMITKMNFLPLNEYYGSLGFHIFGSTIHFFSGMEIILIPKYFPFYTIFLSALVLYNLLLKIFKNKNLAIFGIFSLEFFYVGFNYTMYQYWPSSLALIQGLFIFYLLYSRLINLIQSNGPTKNTLFEDISFYYSLIVIVFISATLTHSLTIILLLISFMCVYFIYFIKDVKKGIDFIILSSLSIIFIILYYFGFGSEHFWFLKEIGRYWKEFVFLACILALPLIFLIWRIKKSIIFTKGRYKSTIIGEKSKFLKKFEDKFIIPISIIIVTIIAIVFFIGNVFLFNVAMITILVVIELSLIIIFGIWGLILFQKKPRGKIILIWGLFLMVILIIVLIFDIIFPSQIYFVRIFNLSSPIIAIGYATYIHKLIKINKIMRKRIKAFFIIFITFSLFSSYIHEYFTINDVTLKEQEISGIQWYSENNNKKSVIITEFGFNYIFIFYDYPYDNYSRELQGNEIHYFLKHDLNLFPPDNHFNKTGHNILQGLKSKYDSDVYITLDNKYYLVIGWEIYGHLTNEEIETYYSLSYLNKIYSAKNEYGRENPLYWVI